MGLPSQERYNLFLENSLNYMDNLYNKSQLIKTNRTQLIILEYGLQKIFHFELPSLAILGWHYFFSEKLSLLCQANVLRVIIMPQDN